MIYHIKFNVLRIREGYEAEPLALGSFLLYAVISRTLSTN